MRLFITDKGYTAWPRDNDSGLTGTGNPNIPSLISNASGFNKYLQATPNIGNIPTTSWFYDNDGDTYNGCSASNSGANIIVYDTPENLAQGADDAIDDGNLSCGKLRWYSSTNGTLVYGLSNSESSL